MAKKSDKTPYLSDPDAARRRAALKRIIVERDLSVNDIARLANVKANSIYNLFHGRSKSLNTSTLERMAAVMPGVTVGALQGSSSSATWSKDGISVITEAHAGVWRESFDLPPDLRERVPLPVTEAEQISGAFGVRVRQPGAEQLFADGTLLVGIPAPRWEPALVPGDKVIVQFAKDGRLEITVREVVAGSNDGSLWMTARSNDPRLNTPIEIPAGNRGRPWEIQGARISIVGVVAAYFVRVAADAVATKPAPARASRKKTKNPETKKPPAPDEAQGVGVTRRR